LAAFHTEEFDVVVVDLAEDAIELAHGAALGTQSDGFAGAATENGGLAVTGGFQRGDESFEVLNHRCGGAVESKAC